MTIYCDDVEAADGIYQVGMRKRAWAGYIGGDGTVAVTITNVSQASIHIRCCFNHYGYITSYGCAFETFAANGPGTLQDNRPWTPIATGNGGTWSITRVSGTEFTINKSAGSYGGAGYWYIIAEGNIN